MRLFHVSEEANISRFVPRKPSRRDLDHSTKLVWAIHDAYLPNFLTPRECPRVAYHATQQTTRADIARFFSTGQRHCVAVEHSWFERMQNTTLYLYEFNPANFRLQDAAAGYYVSEHTEEPIGRIQIDNLFDALFQRNIEVRLLDNLWPLADAVKKSSLQFSICVMVNARPRNF